MAPTAMLAALSLSMLAAAEEPLVDEQFSYWPPTAPPPLQFMWGDEPEAVELNGVTPGSGVEGRPAAQLKLRFAADPAKREKGLSYWAFRLPQPLPLLDSLTRIEAVLRSSLPINLKIGLAPFGFIYHSPATSQGSEFTTLRLERAASELQAWCRRGERDPRQASIDRIILAVNTRAGHELDLALDAVRVYGQEGAKATLHGELLRRQAAAVRVAAVSLPWSETARTLPKVLDAIEVGKNLGADFVALPQECIVSAGEPIPGPLTEALAAKAREQGVYVVGNLRERAGERTYVTSFLLGRDGKMIGAYRKSHKLPDEDMDLGDALPVFETEFGRVALKIGSDRHFAEIDHAYAAQGASLLFWAQMPEPLEDEHLQDRPVPGLAADYGMTYVCSRYASAEPGYLTNFYPTYLGRPIGRAYVVNSEGMRVASTPRTGGVALATIPATRLGSGRGPSNIAGFRLLSQPTVVPPKPVYAKRRASIAAIDAAIGIDALCARLDEVAARGCDLACTYELVWISGGPAEQVARQTATAQANLARLAAKAKEHRMYVMVAGVVDRLERNEAILYDREGREVWRYHKIVQTHPEQIVGDQVPIYDTDFGRLGAWICADEAHVEIPRVLHVLGADLLFTPTQSWGPDATYRDNRDISRAMTSGLFIVQVTHPSSEPLHNSKIIDPAGAVVAQSAYQTTGYCLATLDLDAHRPLRYAREWTARTVTGYLPEYQTDRVPKVSNDLFEVIRRQRRPELYAPINR